jgi:hypothetical protein
MAKLAGGIDATVGLIEAVIKAHPTLKFQSVSGEEFTVRDLAGLARSIQAASAVSHAREIEQSDVQDLERRFRAIQADVKTMIAQLGGAS